MFMFDSLPHPPLSLFNLVLKYLSRIKADGRAFANYYSINLIDLVEANENSKYPIYII